jgi:hypothetical protein
MALGLSVVWLTRTETMAATEEDLEHFRRQGIWTEEEIEETRQHGLLLDTGRIHRLTVRVRSDHNKLLNYGDFLRQYADTVILDESGMASVNDAGELYSVRHTMENLTTSALTNWFLYFGRIPPSKIEGLPSSVSRSEKQKKQSVEEDAALDIAFNKFIRSETATTSTPPRLP